MFPHELVKHSLRHNNQWYFYPWTIKNTHLPFIKISLWPLDKAQNTPTQTFDKGHDNILMNVNGIAHAFTEYKHQEVYRYVYVSFSA